LTITPDKSYNIQIFKGNKWELTFEKSDGIEVLDSGNWTGPSGFDRHVVDLSLNLKKEQDPNHTRYRIKLSRDGKEFENRYLDEKTYNKTLAKFTSGKMSSEDIGQILEAFVNLT
jgi:hypothetical protein